MVDFAKLKNQLITSEGIRFKPYYDTKNKITIGIGHNLTDNGISQAVNDLIYQEDITETLADLDFNVKWWRNLDDVRSRVIIELCFNIGISELLKFHKMLAALQINDFAKAAYELQNSLWFTQVGIRGPKLVNMLLLGQD